MLRQFVLLLLLPAVALAGDEPPQTTPAEATRTEVGQPAPTFAVEKVGGGTFDLAAERGKVVLVNFWATWCPPCIEELPALRDRVLGQFAPEDFAMICVAREESNAKIAAFAKKRGVTALPMGGDVDRSIYAQYAEHTIPRNVVVDRDGRILFQSFGFEEEEFAHMIEVIGKAVAIQAVGVPLSPARE